MSRDRAVQQRQPKALAVDDCDFGDFAALTEDLAQAIVCGLIVEVAYVKALCHRVVSPFVFPEPQPQLMFGCLCRTVDDHAKSCGPCR